MERSLLQPPKLIAAASVSHICQHPLPEAGRRSVKRGKHLHLPCQWSAKHEEKKVIIQKFRFILLYWDRKAHKVRAGLGIYRAGLIREDIHITKDIIAMSAWKGMYRAIIPDAVDMQLSLDHYLEKMFRLQGRCGELPFPVPGYPKLFPESAKAFSLWGLLQASLDELPVMNSFHSATWTGHMSVFSVSL